MEVVGGEQDDRYAAESVQHGMSDKVCPSQNQIRQEVVRGEHATIENHQAAETEEGRLIGLAVRVEKLVDLAAFKEQHGRHEHSQSFNRYAKEEVDLIHAVRIGEGQLLGEDGARGEAQVGGCGEEEAKEVEAVVVIARNANANANRQQREVCLCGHIFIEEEQSEKDGGDRLAGFDRLGEGRSH